MVWLIFAIPLLSLLFLFAFIVDEWLEERQKRKEEEEFVKKYLKNKREV